MLVVGSTGGWKLLLDGETYLSSIWCWVASNCGGNQDRGWVWFLFKSSKNFGLDQLEPIYNVPAYLNSPYQRTGLQMSPKSTFSCDRALNM